MIKRTGAIRSGPAGEWRYANMQRLLLSRILSGILSDMGFPCDFRVMFAGDSRVMFSLTKLEYLVIMILSKR